VRGYTSGTLVNIDRSCSERLEEVSGDIKEGIIASPIAHFDETGMRIEGKFDERQLKIPPDDN
jgi:transposase